jgi:choline dehydrogenase-like flavoprotein
VRHPDDDLRKQQLSTSATSGARCQFVFASPLDDDNYISDRGLGQKAEVRVRPNGVGEAHRETVRELRNRFMGFLGATGLDPNEGMHYGNEGTVHHAGGTLRMSDDQSGVVNDGLRFEAYDNLYACDVSVFPAIPAANPALTLVALAQRLARALT